MREGLQGGFHPKGRQAATLRYTFLRTFPWASLAVIRFPVQCPAGWKGGWANGWQLWVSGSPPGELWQKQLPVDSVESLQPGSTALLSQHHPDPEQLWSPLVALAARRLQPLSPTSSPDRQSVWEATCQGSCCPRGSAPSYEDLVTNTFVILMLLVLTVLSWVFQKLYLFAPTWTSRNRKAKFSFVVRSGNQCLKPLPWCPHPLCHFTIEAERNRELGPTCISPCFADWPSSSFRCEVVRVCTHCETKLLANLLLWNPSDKGVEHWEIFLF